MSSTLESGPYQPQAIAFYKKMGYFQCGPFGDYPEHPLSVFMGKTLKQLDAGTNKDA